MSREATPLSAGGIEARILRSAEWAIYDYELPERPTFVWLGPASTEIHLSAIAPPLLELNRRRGAKLKLISGGKSSLGTIDGMIERAVWSPRGFAAELAAADVGLAPLRDDGFAPRQVRVVIDGSAAEGRVHA